MNKNKGWKSFDENLCCRDMPYEVGCTYSYYEEPIKLCRRGLHFHTNVTDLFNYYPFKPATRICEVIAGDNTLHGEDKSVTDTLHVVRELSWQEVLDLVNIGPGNTGHHNAGHHNAGDRNVGHHNVGHHNAGHRNVGYRNVGYHNVGDYNSGHHNAGHHNAGHLNAGHHNAGDRNVGYHNVGDYNVGSCNVGGWNKSDWNTGYLNTKQQEIIIFNKPTKLTRHKIQFPNFFYFELTRWVYSNNMTEQEKQKHPTHKTVGGYLKTLEYKQAWRESWDQSSDDDKRRVLSLPNFDNEVFFEISGIDVAKELSK